MKKIISMIDVNLIRNGKALLQNINWQVEQGQTWAILGLNGAGKSTLLRLIMAELWKSSGQMTVLGTTFGRGDIPSLRHKIGVVGSFIAERFPRQLLAEQIVLTGRYKSSILYTAYDEQDLEQARNMMRMLEIEHLIARKYATLSQGERQMLLVARSLMEQPQILIFDEATSGLDLFAREKLLKQLDTIRQLPNAPTILYVTHHIEEVTASMTHLLLLKEGEIIAQGRKNEVLTEPILSNFYQYPVQLVELGNERYFVRLEERK